MSNRCQNCGRICAGEYCDWCATKCAEMIAGVRRELELGIRHPCRNWPLSTKRGRKQTLARVYVERVEDARCPSCGSKDSRKPKGGDMYLARPQCKQCGTWYVVEFAMEASA